MNIARKSVAAALALAATMAACQVLLGIENVDGQDPPGVAPDSNVPDPPEAGAETKCPFGPALFEPPPLDRDEGREKRIYTFVLRNLSLQPSERDPLGKDLDGLCTGLTEFTNFGPSCTGRAGSKADYLGGIDNGFGRTVVELTSGLVDPDAGSDPLMNRFNSDVEDGQLSVLVVLYGWNEQPDDAVVNVSFVASFGLESHYDAGVDVGGARPLWNGTDTWTYAAEALEYPSPNPDVPPRFIVLYDGYVSNNVLVIRGTPETPTAFPFLSGTVGLLGGGVTARLVASDAGYTLQEGSVTGSLDPKELHDIVRTTSIALRNSVEAGGGSSLKLLCDTPYDCPVLTNLSEGADMPFSKGAVGSECGRISFALGFDGQEALRAKTPTQREEGGVCAPSTCSDAGL